MAAKATTPVLFLAFANDRIGAGYLRNLPEEARRLQDALALAERAGLCEVVLRQNVTVQQVLDLFQHPGYRHHITLFHYGGHANDYQIILETIQGQEAAAHAAGLATFLAEQRGLHLVFLNGCSTEQQVQGLLDAGVSTVIATSQAINDKAATDFATRFYKGLASGYTVQSAFNQASGAIQAELGEPTRAYVLGDAVAAAITDADRWPWALYLREGAELAGDWNLPSAVDNPLFGLPSLPELNLPEHPFRHLQWFRCEDAPIFFGRGHQIRDLYNRITDPQSAPIILYYGQSGVGKSSLLAAGLLPRLEVEQQITYVRRDQEVGLLGTLRQALHLTPTPATGDDIANTWRAIESERPLTIVLDQIEELYTRPQSDPQAELDCFLAALATLFTDRIRRPRGKLILSFRKEWLAEIEHRLAERELPCGKIFLERLDRRGIIEAVTGVARTPHLQRHYGLTVELGLDELIADDLLADRDSPIAPTLQILLTKLWEQAKHQDFDRPSFDRMLYDRLRTAGLLLSDFLDQQLATLQLEQPGAVDSGLTLDLLVFHTTPLGTVEQRTLSELRNIYPHQQEAMLCLVKRCLDLYLLADPAENQPTQEAATRLTHDTLAPLVRQRFEESDAPGQRALRILESRAVDWVDGKKGTPLDDTDLALMEAGKAGMRAWRPDEERLIQASIARREQEKEERHRIRAEREDARARQLADAQTIAHEQTRRARTFRWAAFIASILLILALVAVLWAVDRQTAAQNNLATAEANEALAQAAQATAEAETAVNLARRLNSEAQQVVDEELRLLLAIEAVRATVDHVLAPLPEALGVVQRVLAEGAIHAVQVSDDFVDNVSGLAFDPQHRWIALQRGSNPGTAKLYGLRTGQLVALNNQTGPVEHLSFGAGGQLLVAEGYEEVSSSSTNLSSRTRSRSPAPAPCSLFGDLQNITQRCRWMEKRASFESYNVYLSPANGHEETLK